MSNDVIVLVINVFCCVAGRFLPDAASLASYVEIDGITAALSVYGFILYRVWFESRRKYLIRRLVWSNGSCVTQKPLGTITEEASDIVPAEKTADACFSDGMAMY